MNFEYKKGDVVFIKIDKEAVGSEQKESRPALVVQNNELNKALKTLIVAPMTDARNIHKLSPTHVLLKKDIGCGLDFDSVILCDQIRVVDKKERILCRTGSISSMILKEVDEAIKITFDLNIIIGL